MKPVSRRLFAKRPSRGFDGAGAVLTLSAGKNRFAQGFCSFAQGTRAGRDGADSWDLGNGMGVGSWKLEVKSFLGSNQTPNVQRPTPKAKRVTKNDEQRTMNGVAA
jgi:hypothetical protein